MTNNNKDIKATEVQGKEATQFQAKNTSLIYLAFMNALFIFAFSFLFNIIYLINLLYLSDNWFSSSLYSINYGIKVVVNALIKLFSLPVNFAIKSQYLSLLLNVWFSFLAFCIFFLIFLILYFLLKYLFKKGNRDIYYRPCLLFILFRLIMFFLMIPSSLIGIIVGLIIFILLSGLMLLLNRNILTKSFE